MIDYATELLSSLYCRRY